MHSHKDKRSHRRGQLKWPEHKIYTEWKLQGGGEGEGWQEITSDVKLTNLVINIKDFGLFTRIMGKEEI